LSAYNSCGIYDGEHWAMCGGRLEKACERCRTRLLIFIRIIIITVKLLLGLTFKVEKTVASEVNDFACFG
jgi:hypothetical protein